jgi:Ca-activated chloride channel family protein
VVFAEQPFILSPPTLDYQLLSKLVSRLDTTTIDGNGTAIGDAVGTAVARMQDTEAKSKVVILLTDGANTAGQRTPEYAIELANAVGCKLYTILIGEEDAAKKKQRGVQLFQRNVSPTNPALLQKMADHTGGKAFIATDAKALRDSMHSILDQLDKTQFEANVSHKDDLFPLLLFPGVVLLGVEALLRSLLLRRFP